MVGINIQEELSTTELPSCPPWGQVDVLDPPTKVWNRPFHTPGAECTEPPGELGLTVPPRVMCQQVVSARAGAEQGPPHRASSCPRATQTPLPPITYLPAQSLAAPTNCLDCLLTMQCIFVVVVYFFGEGCSEKQNALGQCGEMAQS